MIGRLSLGTRLLLAAALTTIVALVIADFVVYAEFRSYLYQQVDQTLEVSHRAVEATADEANGSVNGPGREEPSPPKEGPAALSGFCAAGFETAPGMFLEVRTPSGRIITGRDGREYCPSFQPGKNASGPVLPSRITGFRPSPEKHSELVAYFTAPATSGGPPFRVRASTLDNGDILVVAEPIGGVGQSLDRLTLIEFLVTATAVVAAVILGLGFVRVGLRPLRDVERTADAIASGDLERRVANDNPNSEVGRLATAFNVMLDRIEQAFNELKRSEEALRRFVADASHELRTPIAAVSAYAQLFHRGAGRDATDLSRVLSGIERESERMGRLVEDLLTLTKLDEDVLFDFETVELVGVAHEAIETAAAVGPDWPVSLSAAGPVEVRGDRASLRRLVDNLLSNVRAHTPPGTSATLVVRKEAGFALIEVIDNGPGISEDEAERLFERFFREDRSRSRATGGAGLGLAIVASIARAHGGSVSARRRAEGGSAFRVELPLIADDAMVGDR